MTGRNVPCQNKQQYVYLDISGKAAVKWAVNAAGGELSYYQQKKNGMCSN